MERLSFPTATGDDLVLSPGPCDFLIAMQLSLPGSCGWRQRIVHSRSYKENQLPQGINDLPINTPNGLYCINEVNILRKY
ncbi:MAG: hypothetical protein ACTILK_03610, partial [Bifidobacterium crudilactis]|uniref:hypothetical protein n=1 Tax=Bifidobacterium crudilactis TaxID=327277 RepID=UPI003F9E20D8